MINYYYIRKKDAIFSDKNKFTREQIEDMSVRDVLLVCSLFSDQQRPPIWDKKTKVCVRHLQGRDQIIPELTEKIRSFLKKDKSYYEKIDELKALNY